MDNIIIVQWNMKGFYSQKPYLQKLIDTLSPDVICLQETHLKPKNTPYLAKYHYPPVKKDREDRRGGGVMIYIKKSIQYVNFPINTELELIAAKVFIDNRPIIISNLYLPPDLSNVYIKDELPKMFAAFNSSFIMNLDSNAHHSMWGSPIDNTDSRGSILCEIIEDYNISLLNNGDPTYLTNTGNFTHIDLSICSPELAPKFIWTTYHDPMNSDHFPIILKTEFTTDTNFTPRWNTRKADWNEYRNNLDIPETFVNPTQACKIITDAIMEAAKNSIPIITAPPHYPSAYWWTKECTIAKKRKNKCLNTYKKHKGNLNLWIEFKKSRAIFRRTTLLAKNESWDKFLNNFSTKVNTTQVWKHFNKLSNKPSTQTIVLKEGDHYITDKTKIAETLAKHFASRSNGEYNNQTFNLNKIEKEKTEIKFDKIYNANYNANITSEEFNHALNKCISKSPGPDTLPYSFIQNMNEQQKEKLLKFMNYIFKNGYPDQWRQGIIIPIKKPYKIPTAPESYRPITLNNTMSKLIGKIVNCRLQNYLEYINFYSKVQSGFRAAHSTLDGICRLELDARMAILQKKYCVAVFLDISQAFDTVWHQGVLIKLKEMGLNGYLPNFIKGFLKNRQISVRTGAHTSSPHQLKSGVPQGSVLSPTLFTILINDLFENLPTNVQSSLFADDGAIWTTSDNLNEATNNIQEALNAIVKWTDSWGLTLSENKTQAIIFTTKRYNNPILLTIKSTPIHFENSIKYLGMYFDTRLTWAKHINHTVAKCQKDQQLIRMISYNKTKCDFTTLKRLYTSLILPKIDYGCLVYSEAAKTHLKKLDSIQISSLKIALGALRPTPNFKIEVEANVMPLNIRRKELLLKYSYRVGIIKTHPIREFLINKSPIHSLIHSTKIPALYRVFKEFEQISLNPSDLPQIAMQTKYQTKAVPVHSNLCTTNKSSLGPQQWNTLYKSLIDSRYADHQQIFTDGSKQGNKTASGVWNKNFHLKSRLPDYSTVFTAELYAIYAAISFVKNKSETFLILTDSLSAIKALQSLNRTNHYLITWIKQLLTMSVGMISIEWVPSHMSIDGNERADKLARDALDLETINRIPPAKQEMYALAQCHYRKMWQDEWSRLGESLTKFKPFLSTLEYQDLPRNEQVALTRIRLLTTRICISRFLNKPSQSYQTCTTCNVPNSLIHHLIDCIKYAPYRVKLSQFFSASNIPLDLLNLTRPDIPYQDIADFLKSADLLKKI